jgi:hypothetical protein
MLGVVLPKIKPSKFWLRHYASSQKGTGSNPNDVIESFKLSTASITKENLRGLSPLENYTKGATGACRRRQCQL